MSFGWFRYPSVSRISSTISGVVSGWRNANRRIGSSIHFDGSSPAVVFEAVGVRGIIDDILRRAPVGARVVVAGVCMQADAFHPYFAIAKQINVQFVLAYDPTEFTDCLRAIAVGEIDVAPMITGAVGLDGVGNAFDDLAHPDAHCKILVMP